MSADKSEKDFDKNDDSAYRTVKPSIVNTFLRLPGISANGGQDP
jgi:hypothetical protein